MLRAHSVVDEAGFDVDLDRALTGARRDVALTLLPWDAADADASDDEDALVGVYSTDGDDGGGVGIEERLSLLVCQARLWGDRFSGKLGDADERDVGIWSEWIPGTHGNS